MLNKGNKVGAIITDLLKAFDTLNYNLLLCKLKAYRFNKNALTFIQSYFTNKHQRTKKEDKFSKWQKISTDMPQDSILDSLFFNMFINDLFLFIETDTLCNYADDNTMYYSYKNSNIVISRLRHDFAIIPEWFYENYMVLNPDKCHFLSLGFNIPFPDFYFEKIIIKNVTEEKIIGIVINNNLNFKSHIKKTCNKASQKLSALARISKLTTPIQMKKLINSFINAQFTDCPLIWMFSSKGCYKRINKIHERSLKLILNDYVSIIV